MKKTMSEEYLNKGMDLKRLVLCFQKKLWLVVMMAVLGATFGGILYQVIRAVKMPVSYEAVSKLYISFGIDEAGDVYQYYNGYTWNDLLDTDPILNRIMENLTGYEKDQVIAATKAEILSDIRLLTITVKGTSEKFVREIQAAVENGLVDYAKDSGELKRIEVISSRPPERIFWDNRTTTACVVGAVILAVITMTVLAFFYVLDESVYVQHDAESRYPYPVLGILTGNQRGLQPYAQELTANLHYMLKDINKITLLDMGNHADLRKAEIDHLFGAENPMNSLPVNENVILGEDCSQIRMTDGVIILIPFGTDVGRRTKRVLSLLKNQDCKVLGIIIEQADEEFLNRYYG